MPSKLAVALIAGGVAFVFRKFRTGKPHIGLSVRIKTSILDAVSVKTDRRTRLSAVRGLQFNPRSRRMAPGHSHPLVAGLRADACEFLQKAAASLGKRRYDISVTPRDLRSGAVGERQYRVAKDLLSDSRHEVLMKDDFVTIVDTDYYMSEDELSRYAGHDIGLFCLRPNALSGRTPNSLWAFVSPDEVVEEVDGGAIYRHRVWDWHKDLIVMRKRWCTYLYDPVVREIAPGRIVVVLVLARKLRVPLWLSDWLVPGLREHRMGRMEVAQQGDFLVGSFGTAAKRRIEVRAVGQVGEESVGVSPDTFRAFSIAAKIPNTDRKLAGFELLPSAVERIAKASGEKMKASGYYVLSKYFSSAYVPQQLVNYQCRDGLVFEDGLPGAVVAAVPLAGVGCAPTSSQNNEVRAVEARIENVANSKPFSEDMKKFGAEFAALVVPAPHKGVPWHIAELRQQQDRPAQKARRVQEEQHVSTSEGSLRTSSFQKKETYAKPGDPRLINQVPTEHTNALCSFSGAIKSHLKSGQNGRWYYVGKTPLQIAQGLRGLQRRVGAQLVGGDYSRMDGRTSVDYRLHVLEPVYYRYFGKEYHGELARLFKKERAASTKTKRFKVEAELLGANISGSGITTDLNTLDAAFNEFAARRRMGQEPALAFSHLGAYFGDDSVVDPAVFDNVAAVADENGMVMTREAIPDDAGPGHVVFLARVYPDIRTCLASHPDVVRNLRKLCTVQASEGCAPTELARKLRLKVEGVLITDSHVPVVSQYASALKRVYNLGAVKGSPAEWDRAFQQDSDYRRKKEAGPYPYLPGDEHVLAPSVARGLGISVEELSLVSARLETASTEGDLAATSISADCSGLPDWASWVPTTPTAI